MPKDAPSAMWDCPAITAIIPTFDEASRIGAVLDVLLQVDYLSEIIVVDDGSTDTTTEEVLRAAALDPRVRLLQHTTNQGKGEAMFTGWRATQAACLLFLDSDLINLSPRHIRNLIEPVVNHKADMMLGLFLGGRIHTDFAQWANPWLTGQRCLRAALMQFVSEEAAAGYGFETALTIAAWQQGYRMRIVPLKGVWHPPAEFHRGWLRAIPWRARMYRQILRAWVIASRRGKIDERAAR